MSELPENEGSQPSIEDRMSAILGDGPDSSDAPEVAQPAADDTDEESTTDDQVVDDYEEEVEGVKLRGKKEDVDRIKSERTSRRDYTRRTQEAANLAKSAEDRLQFAAAQQQIMGALMGDYAKLEATRERITQLQSLDIGALYNSDPGQAFNIQRQIDNLKSQASDQERALNGRAQQLQSAQSQHFEKQWQLAVEGAKQRIGQFTPADDQAMLQQVTALGFNDNELRGRFADPRFLQLVYKAAKFDLIQSEKVRSLQSANKAPPMVKPGAAVPGAAAERELSDARARLKKSGRVEDAAALFLRMK